MKYFIEKSLVFEVFNESIENEICSISTNSDITFISTEKNSNNHLVESYSIDYDAKKRKVSNVELKKYYEDYGFGGKKIIEKEFNFSSIINLFLDLYNQINFDNIFSNQKLYKFNKNNFSIKYKEHIFSFYFSVDKDEQQIKIEYISVYETEVEELPFKDEQLFYFDKKIKVDFNCLYLLKLKLLLLNE